MSEVDGKLTYGNVDVGYTFYLPALQFGGFIGYHYWAEKVNARGCIQLATNPFICQAGAIPAGVLGITEDDKWNSLRIGLAGAWTPTKDWKVSAEIAYLRTSQRTLDIHYFTFGPDPASARGDGFQAEALLSYQLTKAFSIGAGARWWQLRTEGVDAFDQLLKYETSRYGAFLQGSVKFGASEYWVARAN